MRDLTYVEDAIRGLPADRMGRGSRGARVQHRRRDAISIGDLAHKIMEMIGRKLNV
jgi:hypothetical protein